MNSPKLLQALPFFADQLPRFRPLVRRSLKTLLRCAAAAAPKSNAGSGKTAVEYTHGCGLSFLRKLADADVPPDLEQYEDTTGPARLRKIVPATITLTVKAIQPI